MKKILKRSIVLFFCFTMIFNYSFTVLADENIESGEPKTSYIEIIETPESNDTTESIEESEREEESEEEIKKIVICIHSVIVK